MTDPHRISTDWIERLAARHGHTRESLERIPKADGPTFSTHSEFFDRWSRYKLDSEPCSGTLRVEDKFAGKLQLRCDGCRFEVSVEQGNWRPNASEVEAAINLPDEDPTDRLLKIADLPSLVAKPFDPSSDNRAAIAACRDWLRDGASVPAPALFGPTGTGKTHLAARTGLQLVRLGRRVLFVHSVSWLGELQASMGSQHMDRLWQRAVSVPVLILDDLGAEQLTEWRLDRIGALVDERSRRELPMLVTSNFGPDGWELAFGSRTASRLSGLVFAIEMQGVDRRVAA